jgi:hypothetical protein
MALYRRWASKQEMTRTPELSDLVEGMIGRPRRGRALLMLERAIERGELERDTDLELALEMLDAPIHWRLTIRDGDMEPDYLDTLVAMLVRALGSDDDTACVGVLPSVRP